MSAPYIRPRDYSAMREPAMPTDPGALRERRRRRQPVVLGGGWDLAHEVADIVTPLARRVADEPAPSAYMRSVLAVLDASAEVVHVASAIVAESAARRDVAVLPYEQQRRARRALAALAPRPELPVVHDRDLASGDWAEALTGYAAANGLSDQLAGVLGRARTSDLNGEPSISDRIVTVLRELDSAGLSLSRKLDKAQFNRETYGPPTRPNPQSTEVEAARRELQELGLEAPSPTP
ncbi:hypothetical protein P0W64_15030 [Tsukamurella sp. 8F]|uniref:hypothetical protein n=1 Tax=Tsukamurella sp. 8F TaxID=3031961 RepID=UPI0023BA2915|nr:hypothetical protein [Tsukamurella sp. 8F]MDF0588091.1 hypothetical protein [Tsukamurella sp. 8F]